MCLERDGDLALELELLEVRRSSDFDAFLEDCLRLCLAEDCGELLDVNLDTSPKGSSPDGAIGEFGPDSSLSSGSTDRRRRYLVGHYSEAALENMGNLGGLKKYKIIN